MMPRVLCSCALVLCTTARVLAQPAASDPSAPAPAPAPVPAPTPPAAGATDADSAKLHFDQAVVLFNDGNYSAALAEFETAYRLRPAAFVLYNIGLTQKALFRYPDAIKSLERFLAESVALAPERQAEAQQIIGELKSLLADVTLKISPPGAAISIDGRPAGTSPLTAPLQLAAGTHAIEVTADGFKPQHRELMVAATVPATVEIALVEIPRTGTVHITASVEHATVRIDGKPAGLTPLDVELLAGGHSLEVVAPKHVTRRDELVVAAGQRRDLRVTLERVVVHRPWYKQWYVWAPIGAVVVGTTAFGLAGGFTSTEDPLAGTLSPGAGGVQ